MASVGRAAQAPTRNGSARPGEGLPRRRITSPRPLPGGRAILGAALMAIAAVAVFLAYRGAADGPTDSVVVARNPLRAGEQLEAADLRLEKAQLPPGSKGTFASTELLVGRVLLAPVGQGEIVQASSVTAERAAVPSHEIELALPREQVAVGRLKRGERVDVFVTTDERTTSVVRGAVVVQIGSTGDGSLTSQRETSLVVSVESADSVAALVHALRTGDVTVVRSTFASGPGSQSDTEPLVFEAAPEASASDRDDR